MAEEVEGAGQEPVASPLEQWLAWLGTPNCTCQYGWKSLGRLYGISMGKGWVRLTTDPECPHHGE